jgi:hypothetical protein
MSNSPRGILAYGYDLGGPENGWNLRGVEKYGNYTFPDWYNEEGDSWGDQAEALLLNKIVNFTEIWKTGLVDYFARKTEAQKQVGVSIVRYGTYDYSGYILATKVHSGPDWGTCPVEISLDHSASAKLHRALSAMQIQPKQIEPKWILGCFYG